MDGDEINEAVVQPLRLMPHTPLVRATYREQYKSRTFDITVEKHLRPERYYWNVEELDRTGLRGRSWDSGPTGYPDPVAAYSAAKWSILHDSDEPA